MQSTVEAMAIDQYRLTQTSTLVLLAIEGRKPEIGEYYFPERKQQGGLMSLFVVHLVSKLSQHFAKCRSCIQSEHLEAYAVFTILSYVFGLRFRTPMTIISPPFDAVWHLYHPSSTCLDTAKFWNMLQTPLLQ